MSYDDALRALEIGLSLALMQRAYEHLAVGDSRFSFAEAVLAMSMLVFPGAREVIAALWGIGLWRLWAFKGPYNGGADKMVMLALTCLTAAHWGPELHPVAGEIAMGYLAVQLVLSYFVSGLVKAVRRDWWRGQALSEVFSLSAYPAAETLRNLAANGPMMRAASWGVIVFELAFPLALVAAPALWIALGLAALFHLANAVLFGLNRFFWAWTAAFPAILWFQSVISGPS